MNRGFEADVLQFYESGLHDELASKGLIIPCEQVDSSLAETTNAAMVLRPERVPFVSYPYEWCFSQLKEAALSTLDTAAFALEKGMILKDASAYNIQFHRGKPVHIDTLSFEKYTPGKPWVAYAQFCRHFLAPLALMAFKDIRLGSLLRNYLDGIPLDLASRLLPWNTRLQPGILLHIHLHAKAIASAERRSSINTASRISDLRPLIASLHSTVSRLKWNPMQSRWSRYAQISNYSSVASESKKHIVHEFLSRITSTKKNCWDLGANTGEFSFLAERLGFDVVAWDSDPNVIETLYRKKRSSILPLVVDFSNPSPKQGWASQERESFASRGPVGVVMALALIHHLTIGNNVPLDMIAEWFASLGEWAIVEFVPKNDSQATRMLAARQDVFDDYNETGFETAMKRHFDVVAKKRISDSERCLYLFKNHS